MQNIQLIFYLIYNHILLNVFAFKFSCFRVMSVRLWFYALDVLCLCTPFMCWAFSVMGSWLWELKISRDYTLSIFTRTNCVDIYHCVVDFPFSRSKISYKIIINQSYLYISTIYMFYLPIFILKGVLLLFLALADHPVHFRGAGCHLHDGTSGYSPMWVPRDLIIF